jgi:hypothetical protein
MRNEKLIPLNEKEILLVNGGAASKLIRGGVWGFLLGYIVDNWEDIKSGASSAYDDYYKN